MVKLKEANISISTGNFEKKLIIKFRNYEIIDVKKDFFLIPTYESSYKPNIYFLYHTSYVTNISSHHHKLVSMCSVTTLVKPTIAA